MTKHRWHKEIKAWADGAEIESRLIHDNYGEINGKWETVEYPRWNSDLYEYRIKPQPKEPQYLYVYLDDRYELSTIPIDNPIWQYIGKIKLEVEDGN